MVDIRFAVACGAMGIFSSLETFAAEAIIALKDRTGSSKHSIVQFLESQGHSLKNNVVNAALAKGQDAGVLATAQGHGGSYIITPATREALKKKESRGKLLMRFIFPGARAARLEHLAVVHRPLGF